MNIEEITRQIQLNIYTSLLVMSSSNETEQTQIVINSEADDAQIKILAKINEEWQSSIYDIVLKVSDRPYIKREGEQLEKKYKIEVSIAVVKQTINDNPAGTFTAKQSHSVFLSPPGQKNQDTLPHPSFVVEYIANDILGLGVG